MKKLLPLLLFFLFSCGIKTESGHVVRILYPSDKLSVSKDFYIFFATVKWNDTFVFNPFLFGRVKEIDTEGMEAEVYIDGKRIFKTEKAKHHFLRLNLPEGKHRIVVKTERGKDSVEIEVDSRLKSVFKRDDSIGKRINKIREKVIDAVFKYLPVSDRKKVITEDGYRLIKIVPSEKKVLLIWKKFAGYTSFFRFNLLDIKEHYRKEDFKDTFELPEDLIYGDKGELYLSGLDLKKEGAVVSCGDGFLFRILKEESVILYKLNNDGTSYSKVVSLYEFADKNDKLMTNTYKYPNYYHISCNRDFSALAYPVYGDYNLDYKLVVFKSDKVFYTDRLEDFDNFKLKIFLTERGTTLFQKIPDRVITTEKSRIFIVKKGEKREILFPLPFNNYRGINRAYVSIKGVYYPPKIKLKGFNLDRLYIRSDIFGKRGFFYVDY